MYQFRNTDEGFENFVLPFGGKLKISNRWVVLGKSIPWGEFEESYSKEFKKFNKRGRRPTLNLAYRMGAGQWLVNRR